MLAGIRDILIITTPHDQAAFQHLLGDGSQWGINLSYAIQPSPDGLAQAFLIGEEFIGNDPAALILGDNIFYGDGMGRQLQHASERRQGADVFGYYVTDPERYGVVEFDQQAAPCTSKKSPLNRAHITPSPACIFTTTMSSNWPRRSNPRHAANWKSPTSTMPTSHAAI